MAWIEQFGHGGDLFTASEKFSIDPDLWIDFSANINPLGPPQELFSRIQEDWKWVQHYPDPAHRKFTRMLSEKFKLPQSFFLVGNGAAECMALAILGLEPKTVGVVYPCFSEYEKMAKSFGVHVIGCFSDRDTLRPDFNQLFKLFTKCDLVFIGNPNNPTGVTYSDEELKQMAKWTDETDTYLVMDEAFIDFLSSSKQLGLLSILEIYPKVVIIRSLTKFYAIPGLRLGFAIASPDMIKKMKNKQITWSVNQLALVAGAVCLNQTEYEEETRLLIRKERNFLIESIRNDLGWQVWPSEANFLLVRLPLGFTATGIQQQLGRKGILIRNCSMYPGLTSRDFRIAVRSRGENCKLLNALKAVGEKNGIVKPNNGGME
ncbi:threonine-phosphate decarboxylase CobD [Microaerobacter geothermalis]|uniref:threonine-phosphate decarboxylase CobD n=1 Tax=Microaerobacter geothermalis TaxID=674972 RepID=UPI001F029FB1|nr:threonine-phosphate decarboxylase CobD [Microaerobacter geothermalis]MCF6093095.1 threonine-phosphate decarboxylase CobD [Microaerobacter geothermalis]